MVNAVPAMDQRLSVTLDDKYELGSGSVLMSGVQAIVRLLLDQRHLDQVRGLATGVFISGYPGSPLGGLDRELERAEGWLKAAGIVFRPAVNEELAATAVAGTQLLGELPGRRLDGVAGFWYGKNPGLDRAADAIRHGQVSGTASLGGAVALIGDDPLCKSSTLPSSCEAMCRSLMMPLLAPADLAEIIELGLHAVALSRASGMWTGLKIVSDIADAAGGVEVGGVFDRIPEPFRVRDGRPPVLLGATSVAAEHDLMTNRLTRAHEYARAERLNRVFFEPSRPRLGIAASGATFATVLRALKELGLEELHLDALGVRIIQIRMPWPLDRTAVRDLTAGLERLLVIEDKLPFIESQLKEQLFGVADAPTIVGRHDVGGNTGVGPPVAGGAEAIERLLGQWLPSAQLPERARARLVRIAERVRATTTIPVFPARTPFFCSGCPHNRSTKAAPDQVVGAGIGCHALVALDPAGTRGHLVGAPQMGGEGAQWFGMAPFTDDAHYVQNMGDGTFHHSGSLAVRAAVAAGVNVTYKLLYNDAIAMTGGQRPEGRLDVATLTRWLELEGVSRVVVTTDDPRAYRRMSLSKIASVRHRDDLEVVGGELARIPGVTVLIYDDRCATEERRMRKRGQLPTPAERVWVNERVCEGCGDCGEKSSCLSVQPVETEFGRKTQIHQPSCSSDLSCLQGDCPSFVLVTPGERRQATTPPPFAPPVRLPEVEISSLDHDLLIRIPGIGGTGVVTLAQVIQMAALLDGWHVRGIDQTGLAQKGGPVISDIRISKSAIVESPRATIASADLILGLDLLGCTTPDTVLVCDQARTTAVVNTDFTPTAAMVTKATAEPVATNRAVNEIERVTQRSLLVDAQTIAEKVFGDHMPMNMVMLGAAYQYGVVPLSRIALERAIRLNGVAAESNLMAFAWGRAAVTDRDAVMAAVQPARGMPDRQAPREGDALWLDLVEATGSAGVLRHLLEVRAADLVDYQDINYARSYVESVASVAEIERRHGMPESAEIAEAYARGLYRLMAYKDEYEVARLHLDAHERSALAEKFGSQARASILLHPPTLRALGLKRKVRLGPWLVPVLRMLRGSKRVRGSRFDPFGRTRLRRVERELVGEYRAMVADALSHLTPETHREIVDIVELVDLVRGYEQIKMRNIELFRARATSECERLRSRSDEVGRKPRANATSEGDPDRE